MDSASLARELIQILTPFARVADLAERGRVFPATRFLESGAKVLLVEQNFHTALTVRDCEAAREAIKRLSFYLRNRQTHFIPENSP